MAPLNLSTSICQFSAELYDKINSCNANDTNLIFSPFSIHLALTLGLMGAGGETAVEITKGLGLPAIDNEDIANAYQMLIASLGLELKIANKMFLMQGLAINNAFNNIATTQFASEIQEINLKDTKVAAETINTWIENKTNNAIKSFLAPSTLRCDSFLVVVNAIYLKCKWSQMFTKCTKEQFFTSYTTSVMVDMMHQNNAFPYAEIDELDSKVVVLDYKETNVSMVIVLPNMRTGLDALDRKLKTTPLSHIIQQIMNLYLPKFNVECKMNLEEVLKKMGMISMFSQTQANFENIFDTPKKVFIGTFLHNGCIKVDEYGIEAAACTVYSLNYVSRRSTPDVEFKADHPFHYFICNKDNIILFEGRFRNNNN